MGNEWIYGADNSFHVLEPDEWTDAEVMEGTGRMGSEWLGH